MAEEFAFHQLGRNRAAVDRHERAVGAAAFGVDGARDQFLAHAGLAGDVHRRLAARDLADGLAQFDHRRRFAVQARAHGLAGAAAGVVEFQRVPHQIAQHRQIDRLGDEIEGAGLERIDRGFDVAEGGDHRHRGVRVLLADLGDQIHARAVRQAHVGQAQVVTVAQQLAASLAEARRGVATQAHPAQGHDQQLANIALVIDYQCTTGFSHYALHRPR